MIYIFFFAPMPLTILQNSILLNLAKYHFLTRSQMHLLNLGSMTALHRALRPFSLIGSAEKFVHVHSFPPSARWGRLQYVYSLTPAGYHAAMESAPEVTKSVLPKETTPLYPLDYFHRMQTISFRIRLENALSGTACHISKYFQYFEKIIDDNERFGFATHVPISAKKFFLPDSIFVLSNDQQQGVFTLEMVWTPQLSRLLYHVRQHMHALSSGILSSRFGVPRQDYRALFVVRDHTLLRSLLLRLERMKIFAPFRHHFLFAPIAHTEHDILGCWRKVGYSQEVFNFIDGSVAYKLPRKCV